MPDDDLQKIFDFLELKRGDKLGCSVCCGNSWSYGGRVGVLLVGPDGIADTGKVRELVQLVCANCKQVLQFSAKIADGLL